MRATCLGEDACSPSTSRGSQFPPSWSLSPNRPNEHCYKDLGICERCRSGDLYLPVRVGTAGGYVGDDGDV